MNNEYPEPQQVSHSSLPVRLRLLCTQLFRLTIFLSNTSSIAPVAVLIDGDNIPSDLIAPILAEAGKFGGVTIRRVYGNWASPSMQSWQQMVVHYGLEQRHCEQVATGKTLPILPSLLTPWTYCIEEIFIVFALRRVTAIIHHLSEDFV